MNVVPEIMEISLDSLMINLDTHPCSGIPTMKEIERTRQWNQTAFRTVQIAHHAPKSAPVRTCYLI